MSFVVYVVLVLWLPRNSLDVIRDECERAYPNEACGILIGGRDGEIGRAHEVIVCTNIDSDSPQNRYSIAPQDLIAAQKRARENGLEIVGFYHSHPDHPPQWSPRDLNEAHWIGCSYVIVSVIGGKAGEARSYLLRGEREFADEEFSVES